MFIKHHVSISAKTKLDVTPDFFSLDQAADQMVQQHRNQSSRRVKESEDKEAQIELL